VHSNCGFYGLGSNTRILAIYMGDCYRFGTYRVCFGPRINTFDYLSIVESSKRDLLGEYVS